MSANYVVDCQVMLFFLLGFLLCCFFLFCHWLTPPSGIQKNGLTIITINLSEASFKISKKLKNVAIVSIDQIVKNPSKKIFIPRFYSVGEIVYDDAR